MQRPEGEGCCSENSREASVSGSGERAEWTWQEGHTERRPVNCGEDFGRYFQMGSICRVVRRVDT